MAERPRPVLDDRNRHYWDGARAGKLVLQRCTQCSTYVHPPRDVCPACRSTELDPSEVSGKGTVYSWSVMHSAGNPGFEDKLPYAVLLVELDEQARLLAIGNLVDASPADLAVGAPVEVCFEKVDDELVLPQWRLSSRSAS